MKSDVIVGAILVVVLLAGTLLISVVFSVALMEAGPQSSEHGRCLQHGYPNIERADGSAFCIRRVNGTDEVVPVSTLQPKNQSLSEVNRNE